MTKDEMIQTFNSLKIPGMGVLTELYELKGDFINLVYTLPSGQQVRLWEDEKTYLGAELCKEGRERCYGLVADERYLLVCEYGAGGRDAEIVYFSRLDSIRSDGE